MYISWFNRAAVSITAYCFKLNPISNACWCVAMVCVSGLKKLIASACSSIEIGRPSNISSCGILKMTHLRCFWVMRVGSRGFDERVIVDCSSLEGVVRIVWSKGVWERKREDSAG